MAESSQTEAKETEKDKKQTVKNSFLSEIEKIKAEQTSLGANEPIANDLSKTTVVTQEIRFDESQNKDSGENVLGDLLGVLRTNRLMSTLMICRQIERIDIQNGVANLFSETADLSELVQNDKHKSELDKFFKSKGLSFKLLEKKKDKNPIDELREFFGDKLIVQ